MKILVTGATGYIGASASRALKTAGHDVFGLARSSEAEGRLRQAGLGVAQGDFSDHQSLALAVRGFDSVVSTASTAGLPGEGNGFDRDRDAVIAMLGAMEGSGKMLVFTSGSAALGVFANGARHAGALDEDIALPLPADVVAPPALSVNPMLVEALSAAMGARIETEKAVLQTSGVQGIVMRPGLVFGNGGSFDIPALIDAARKLGAAPHVGPGESLHSYLHIDDLGELYRHTVQKAPKGAVIHGAAGDVSMLDLAKAVSRLIGVGDATRSVSLEEMFAAAGPPGVSLALHKVMGTEKTHSLLGWAPRRTDILEDVASGSYVR